MDPLMHSMAESNNEHDGVERKDFASADISQPLMSHLPDVPSDLALNHYKVETYAKLEDILENRNANKAEVTRHDSHHFPDREGNSIQVVQVEAENSSNEDDDNDAFEMQFTRFGSRRLHASKDSSDVEGENTHSPSLAPNRAPQSLCKSYPPQSLITPAASRALENVFTSDSSDLDVSDASGERGPGRGGQREEYPHIPPEPSLQPVQRGVAFPEDPSNLQLDNANGDLPSKHHIRARTFPLRMRPIPTHVSDTHLQSHSQEQVKVLSPPPDTLRHTAATLQVPSNHQNRPLHLQPHPGRARPLPPTHPRPHFAPNPAPIAVPLPRRPSNPPPPVSAETDKFYRELKSKLWKLAQELEARGDANRVSFKEDEIPSPDTPSDDLWDEDDDTPWDDEVPVIGAANDEAVDEQSVHGSDVEIDLDGSKRRNSSFGVVRRMSEGRGRRAARERAERAKAAWLRGPD